MSHISALLFGQRWDWILDSKCEATEETCDETDEEEDDMTEQLSFYPAKERKSEID